MPETPKISKRGGVPESNSGIEDIGDAKSTDFFQTSGRLTAQFVDDAKKETGKPFQFVISKITKERRMFTDENSPMAPVLQFEEIELGSQSVHGFLLNSTNNKILVEHLGDTYKNWIGATVTVSTIPTKKPDGTPTKGILVTDVIPPAK